MHFLVLSSILFFCQHAWSIREDNAAFQAQQKEVIARIEASVDQAIEAGNLFPLLATRHTELRNAWNASYAQEISKDVMQNAQADPVAWASFWAEPPNQNLWQNLLKIYAAQDAYGLFDSVVGKKRKEIAEKFTDETTRLNFYK